MTSDVSKKGSGRELSTCERGVFVEEISTKDISVFWRALNNMSQGHTQLREHSNLNKKKHLRVCFGRRKTLERRWDFERDGEPNRSIIVQVKRGDRWMAFRKPCQERLNSRAEGPDWQWKITGSGSDTFDREHEGRHSRLNSRGADADGWERGERKPS